ncbi:MAG: helicase, partial [Verrucomicrobia bacterium]|nr:helicase [Verrucomicrobiota bacterium]
FIDIARNEGLNVDGRVDEFDSEALGKCMLAGFSDHLAKRLDSGSLRCDLVHKRHGVLARESVVHKTSLFVAAEIQEIQGRNDELIVLLSLATGVREEWLKELFPSDFKETTEVFLDCETRRVQSRVDLAFRDLIIHRGRIEVPPCEIASRLLAKEVISGRYSLAHFDDEIEQWIIRLNCLVAWAPELALPGIDSEARSYLIQQICQGAFSYKEIKDRQVWPTMQAWLSSSQRHWIDQLAPSRLELPNGRRAKLRYTEGQSPVLAARIQDLYGIDSSLKICKGRIAVVVHVLSPNHRPIQITQDLTTFWRESYPKIKNELQRKYPKHEWR